MNEAELTGGGTGATPPPPPTAAPVAWEPTQRAAAEAGPYGGRRGAQLTITDALTAGYKNLLNPDFAVPILVLGVVIQLVVLVIIAPFIVGLVLQGDLDPDNVAVGGAVIGLIAGGVAAAIAGIIGGILLNLYGQVWALEASNGRPLKIADAFAVVGQRWVNILGAGIIVGALELAMLIALGLQFAILGALGILVFLAGLIVMIYVAIRLSMSGWLAADGAAPMAAVQGSWELTKRHLTTIIYWSVAIGIVVFLITTVAGLILGFIPLVGAAVTQTLGAAFGFGAGATLYHRVKDA
jgi:hypothetical protein